MEVVLALTVVVFAFYFILLRPVIAQQRRQRRDIAGLAEGDEVLTTGGFYARVREISTQDDGPMLILLIRLVLRASAPAKFLGVPLFRLILFKVAIALSA